MVGIDPPSSDHAPRTRNARIVTFTYAGDPQHSPKDLIRFAFLLLILTNTTRSFRTKRSLGISRNILIPYETCSWRLCEIAAANAGRMVDSTSGEIKVMLSQRQEQLLTTAKTLRAQSSYESQYTETSVSEIKALTRAINRLCRSD